MVTDRRQLKMRTPRAVIATAAIAAVAASTGCSQRSTIYDWGRYEQLVYQMYAKPGKADPGTQIVKLTEDIGRTEGRGRRVPPGVHAHLGYLYYTQGQADLAAEQFQIEKELFPESTVFIDGIRARMTR